MYMDRNINVITDLVGNKIVIINDIYISCIDAYATFT